jgi:pimeloyl-ACP methyl ester carboxylesterase
MIIKNLHKFWSKINQIINIYVILFFTKFKTMKNRFLIWSVLFLFVISACKNNEEEQLVPQRGAILSYSVVGSYSAVTLESLFAGYLGEQAGGALSYEFDISLYSVKYQTIDAHDNLVQASGLLVIPNSSTAKPLLTFAHGTMLNSNNVPSKAGSGREAGLLFATEGYVTVLPDFLGLGSSEGLHPFIHAETEATATIDMLRAVRNLASEINLSLSDQLFITGYSQGGHVAMATHKYIQEEYSSEFTVTASAPLAGPYDVSGIMLDTLLLQKPYIEPAFLPYLLFAYNDVYKLYDDINSIFAAPYNTTIKNYIFPGTSFELSQLSATLPESRIPTDILSREVYQDIIDDMQHPIREALAKNNLYDWKPEAPIYLVHCGGDVTVPMSNSEKAYDYFKRNGASNVQFVNPSNELDHIGCVVPSMLLALQWFNSFK